MRRLRTHGERNGRKHVTTASSRRGEKLRKCNERCLSEHPQDSARQAQPERVRQRIIEGLAVREITREVASSGNLAMFTLAQWDVAPLRDRLYGLGTDALEALGSTIRTKKDWRAACQVLSIIGAIAAAEQKAVATIPRPTEEEALAKFRRMAAEQLVQVAVEKKNVYGTPLPPPMEELQNRILRGEAEAKTRGSELRPQAAPESQQKVR